MADNISSIKLYRYRPNQIWVSPTIRQVIAKNPTVAINSPRAIGGGADFGSGVLLLL